MARKPVVYVSSTFIDLKNHRAEVKTALEKAQFDTECMEKYPAFDERPLDKCLADVARADIYVLVISHRYGYRPTENNPERKSITQLEYEEAGRHANKPRLVFTVAPQHRWNPEWVDRGDDARDLGIFRATVEQRHGINTFTEPHHLANVVQAALHALKVKAPPDQPDAPSTKWNWPRAWDFSGYLTSKRRGFVGREWLFDQVSQWYENVNAAQALLICADFGVGKSAFMAELTQGSRKKLVHVHHFCHHDTAETLNAATFVRSVGAQLADALPEYCARVESDPEARRWFDEVQRDPCSAFEQAVVAPLNTIPPPDSHVLLLVDALDEALDVENLQAGGRTTTIVQLLATAARRLPPWLRILATSRRRREVLQPMQQAFQCEMLDGEDNRNLDDIRTYVVGRCNSSTLSRSLADAKVLPSELAAFLASSKQSGGKFLYATRVLTDIESGALSLTRLKELPPGMDAFYLDAFERRFPGEGDYSTARPLIGVLSQLREPMSREELAAILGIKELEIRDRLAKLEDFLNTRGRHYSFDHVSLNQWLVEEDEAGFARAGRFAVDVDHARSLLSGWVERERAAGRAHLSTYLARHLGTHLSAAQRNSAYRHLLLDLDWLNARLRAVGINTLLADWADLEATEGLQTLQRALRHGAHVFGHDGDGWHGPDLLATQLLGRLRQDEESSPELRHLSAQSRKYLQTNGLLLPLSTSLQSPQALLRTIEGHTITVAAIAVLPDGRLASGSWDGRIKLWNPTTGMCEMTLQGDAGAVYTLALLPDGRLVSGAWDHTIKLWNLTTGRCERTLKGHWGGVCALAVSSDGRLASASWDCSIKLWNVSTGICEATLEGHAYSVWALAAMRDGRLASASEDATIKLWDLTTGRCEVTLRGHERPAKALATIFDGRLASASEDTTIKLWNLTTGACEITLEGHQKGVETLALLPDGRLASGSSDTTIKLWNLASGRCEATLQAHTSFVDALAILPNGHLVSGAGDRTIKLWSLAKSASGTSIQGHTSGASTLVVLPDGRLAAGSDNNSIQLWNPKTTACEATFEAHSDSVIGLAVLPDGRLASASLDETIKLWNPATGTCEATLEARKIGVIAPAVLADGRLVSGGWDDTIKLWNPVTRVCEAVIKTDRSSVTALAVLPDGRLASGSWTNLIKLWNPGSGACEATLDGHSGSVCALVPLPDGRLASASHDHTIRLWNVATGLCEATLQGHAGAVTALVPLPDGRLASVSEDRTLRIWSIHEKQSRYSVEFVADADLESLAFVPTTSALAAGDRLGRVHFLEYTHPHTTGILRNLHTLHA
jgi:WD40 repeat protein